MADISVKIEVLNSIEVVKSRKGKLMGSLYSLWSNEETLRRHIEEEICREVVQQIRLKLGNRLKEEGILAHLHIEVKP